VIFNAVPNCRGGQSSIVIRTTSCTAQIVCSYSADPEDSQQREFPFPPNMKIRRGLQRGAPALWMDLYISGFAGVARGLAVQRVQYHEKVGFSTQGSILKHYPSNGNFMRAGWAQFGEGSSPREGSVRNALTRLSHRGWRIRRARIGWN
jgi:hypothetical protein